MTPTEPTSPKERPRYVRELMTKDVFTLDVNEKLSVADDIMRLGRVRHLPIVDAQGALAGIVSQRDLFHSGLMKTLGPGTHAPRQAPVLFAKESMKTGVVTTTPDTKLSDAARVMLDQKVGCLVVLDGGKIAGILTESDFVKLCASE